jgi:uncharacterized protein (DUF983 family)
VSDDVPARPPLVDAHGRPARQAADRLCPQCGAGPDARVASGGFGTPWPVCARCGYEWVGEVFAPREGKP